MAVDLMHQLLGEWGVKVGRKKNMSPHLENLCQNAELNESVIVQGQVGVLWGNKIIGQISCSVASLAPPFCVFSSLVGTFLFSQFLNVVLILFCSPYCPPFLQMLIQD